MKTICALLICFALVGGCKRAEDQETKQYYRVYQHLVADGIYRRFCGYEIVPRDDSYYLVTVCPLKVTIATEYVDRDSVIFHTENERTLRDTVAKHFPGKSHAEVERVLDDIRVLVRFMKEESLVSVMSSGGGSETGDCSIEFRLSEHEFLLYSNKPRTVSSADSQGKGSEIQIDTSWVYVKKEVM